MFHLASEQSEDQPEEQQEPSPKNGREGSKYFRDSNNMNADAIISDDDDFEADLKAAQQQMNQKVAHNPMKNDDNQDEQDMFEEHARLNSAALAHQKYNTDKIAGAGLSEKKLKKKKKKNQTNIVNQTALVDAQGTSFFIINRLR